MKKLRIFTVTQVAVMILTDFALWYALNKMTVIDYLNSCDYYMKNYMYFCFVGICIMNIVSIIMLIKSFIKKIK